MKIPVTDHIKKLSPGELRLSRTLCKAIKNGQMLQFPYQSSEDKYPTLRKIEPYLVIITKKGHGKVELVGYPVNRVPLTKELGHYLFEKLNLNDIVVLEEVFERLQVEDKKVYDTPEVLVLCRVSFDK